MQIVNNIQSHKYNIEIENLQSITANDKNNVTIRVVRITVMSGYYDAVTTLFQLTCVFPASKQLLSLKSNLKMQ